VSVEHTLVSVMTAGDVGAIQPRLGVASFDVTASVDTPDELIFNLEAATPPDVIIVESALFPTVESIVHLAPDALVIAIGDQTPVGAIGHIPAGMSGGAIASLVHALLAGGVTAAVAAVASFEPGGAPVVDVTGANAGRFVRSSYRATIVTGGAIAASLVAAISWGLTLDQGAPVDEASHAPRVAVSPILPPPIVKPDATEPPPQPVYETEPRQGPAEPPEGAGGSHVKPSGPRPGPEPPAHTPPPSNPPQDDGREPRGKHLGWEHMPPKHQDHGNHHGWE
jgi:hypothetical protein